MSLLYAVVFATRCRSNHHRLAVDALRHLRTPEAEYWAELFLHFHADYLRGAKAPDDEFKDFKNHVLHVREGEWGGAIESCEEWYRRTVRALSAGDWRQAAWSAGVLSHYYVDPLQPFHTHQTEEEGVIHRAVEWSFSKSYRAFQDLLESHGGYPEIEAPAGKDWLAQMVRAGAKTSNVHYELIIDHYDLDRGVKDPPAGLDDAIRRAVAPLVGHAAVGFARILDRAVEEAQVRAPRLGGGLQAFFLALEAPIQSVLKLMDDAKARAEVEAQYEEYRRTGKVRATLGEDDKVVRALHAAEVLKAPLSSIDSKWPREIGAKAGQPEERRTPAPAPKPRREKAAVAESAEAPVKAEKPSAEKLTLDSAAPVEKAPSIGPKTAKRLEAVGVHTIADLLALEPEKGQRDIGARHISAQLIRDWQAQATLACSVPGMKSREAQALVACGVRTAEDLAKANPADLTEAIANWGLSEEGARAWGTAPAPSVEDVSTWVERSKRVAKPAAKKVAA